MLGSQLSANLSVQALQVLLPPIEKEEGKQVIQAPLINPDPGLLLHQGDNM